MSISRVGSKGELFPPKEIRERLGLRPHVRVVYKVEAVGGARPEPRGGLEGASSVEVTLEEFHGSRRELSRKAES